MNDLTFAATLLSCFVALVFAAIVEVLAPAGSVSSPAITVRHHEPRAPGPGQRQRVRR